LQEKMICLEQAASSRNIDKLRACLQDVVPEFKREKTAPVS